MYPINITDYMHATAAKFPDKIAIIQNEKKLSFAELLNRVLSLAHQINRILEGKKRQIITVLMPKGLEAAVADLAILYSGNTYMNLDSHNPVSRLNLILKQTNPALLLYANDSCPLQHKGFKVELDKLPELDDKTREQTFNLRNGLIDTDLMCLINTSGSTGVPKAVALSHRSFIDFVEAVRESGLIKKDEVIGSLSPIMFDIWSFELCMVMAYASALVCLPENEAAFPLRLLEHVKKSGVSFIFWVPTIMVNIANMKLLDELSLPDLKMIWFAGEVFPTSKFNYWHEKLPGATFANFYGPIEITLDCLYHVIKRPMDPAEPIPIGKPFRNTGVLVLDENQHEIKSSMPGIKGELCIRGSSLAMGYYNNPEKTAATFTQNPLNPAYPEIIYHTGDIVSWNKDGELIFKGRKDTLIKHSGYRIELGEIEHAAINIPGNITNVCALYDKTAKEIWLIYESPVELDQKELRRALGKALPRYMLPHRYYWLVEMPRNPNGKIDRKLLQDKFLK